MTQDKKKFFLSCLGTIFGTGASSGSKKPNEDAKGFPQNRYGEKIDYTIYCP